WNREQDLVGHDAENSLRQRTENGKAHDASSIAKKGENQRHTRKRQRDLIARHQRSNDDEHHEDCENLGQRHQRVLSTATARIACAIPCSAINSANSGISVLSRKTSGRPLASCERSRIDQERAA